MERQWRKGQVELLSCSGAGKAGMSKKRQGIRPSVQELILYFCSGTVTDS